ncbi:hypothetical protein C8R47DRAFT_1080562 [Mycena vitilis]|nr:hypothetical protein C8R47DRAFT_1080562 [Mycena vitilis]
MGWKTNIGRKIWTEDYAASGGKPRPDQRWGWLRPEVRVSHGIRQWRGGATRGQPEFEAGLCGTLVRSQTGSKLRLVSSLVTLYKAEKGRKRSKKVDKPQVHKAMSKSQQEGVFFTFGLVNLSQAQKVKKGASYMSNG